MSEHDFDFNCIDSKAFAIAVAAFSITIAEGLSTDEQAIVGEFLVAVGDTLSLMATKNELTEKAVNNANGNKRG